MSKCATFTFAQIKFGTKGFCKRHFWTDWFLKFIIYIFFTIRVTPNPYPWYLFINLLLFSFINLYFLILTITDGKGQIRTKMQRDIIARRHFCTKDRFWTKIKKNKAIKKYKDKHQKKEEKISYWLSVKVRENSDSKNRITHKNF